MPSAPHPPRVLRRRSTRRASGAAALAVLVLAGSVATTSPIAAQQAPSPAGTAESTLPQPRTEEERAEAARKLEEALALAPESPPSPDDPFAELAEATAEVRARALVRLQATALEQSATSTAFVAAVGRRDAEAAEDAATEVRDAAADEAAEERERLKDLAVKAFVSGGTAEIEEYRAFVQGDTSEPEAGQRIMFNQVIERQERVTERSRRDLADARAALRVAREELDDARAVADVADARLASASEARVAAQRAHEEAVAERDAVLADLRAGAGRSRGPVPLEVPLLGLPRLTAADLASWFEAGAWRSRIATPIEDLAAWFIREGQTEGVRGDIAFAQAVLETGGFANTDSVLANNYSGIGHYDNVPLGFIFPSPEAGVRAQIQLLKGYAIERPDYVNPLVDRRLRGPAGCCATWGELTTVWATDPTYGPKVMLLYTSLVEHAFERRSRGEGFELDGA